MGTDLLDGEVEITEFEAIDVQSIKGVPQGANGFPVLMMKGLAKGGAAPTAEQEQAGVPAWAHRPFDGDHAHDHPAFGGPDGDGDGTHGHEHHHSGDANHHHKHSTSKGLPSWHSPAAMLARLALENPGKTPEVLFKAVAADGTVDEQPDIDGGKQAIALIAKLIGYEAQELEAGELDETSGIGLLLEAAGCLKYWLGGEQKSQAGADAYGDDGAWDGVVMASLAEPFTYAADDVAKDSREFSAAERKKHAAAGNALPDGSYPIPDADALGRAAVLARSKHGDWKAARKLIAKRAKELGVANPLDDDKSDGDSKKSAVAEGGTAVDTDGQETGSLSKAVEDALAKALGPLEERMTAFGADLAKVMAAPVPGGPVLSNVRATARAGGGDDWAAKAAYYGQKAELAVSPEDRDGYRQLAREAQAKAQAATA